MNSKDRKDAIVRAALPLFAKQGFANTTTRQLALAAGVSEALLYKHFPSKESLYESIKKFGSYGNDKQMENLLAMEPSTPTLVTVVCYLVRRFVAGVDDSVVDWETRTRLFLHSCLEDGSFMRFLFDHELVDEIKRLESSIDAAGEAGDLVDIPGTPRARLLFCHQMAIMIGGMHLPEEPAVKYGCGREELVEQAALFALRGLGLTEEAIDRYFSESKKRSLMEV